MSYSPPIRRLSTAASSREELINAYEAEEERIINVLSRKLEQLRQEKIGLENVMEAESESHVNRLSRELSALRIAQQQLQQHQSNSSPSDPSTSSNSAAVVGLQAFSGRTNPLAPSTEIMLEAMRRDNEQLRARLSETEREFIRITRMNDIYREELIEHRRKAGIPVDDLIGMPSTSDPLAQPIHRRPSISNYSSTSSSPSTSIFHQSLPPAHRQHAHHSNGVPIPRPPSQLHRPSNHRPPDDLPTPLSRSSPSTSSSDSSPFPFSPPTSASVGVFNSAATNITSPPSSASFNQNQQQAAGGVGVGGGARGLTYPSVPPPSLSSSFGSPNISYHMPPPRDVSLSPIEPLSRRNSINSAGASARRGSVDASGASGSSRSRAGTGPGRRGSLEFGARVAETGTLVPRGHHRTSNSNASLGSGDWEYGNAAAGVGSRSSAR